MDLPEGYRFRAPTRGDLDAVAAVLIADDLDDAGEVVLDEDFLLTGWNLSDFDLATDAWVVVDGAEARSSRTDRSCTRGRASSDRGGSCIPRSEGEGSVPRCWNGSRNARTIC